MIRVYIASPYTIGDVAENVANSMAAASDLICFGYAPYCPLLNHYLQIAHPQDYDKWMELDIEWLKQCDAVLRLPGESKGADVEVRFAEENDIPVYHSLFELRENIDP